MRKSTAKSPSSGLITWLKGDSGLCGRIALSWALAGGLTMQALLVISSLVGSPGAMSLPLTATLFFVMGAAGGFTHGVLVGMAGRASGVCLSEALRGVEAGVLWAIPTLVAGWVAALWMSMTSLALTLARPSVLLVVLAGWTVCILSCVWALREARAGIRYAMMRWPERRPGAPLVVLTFVVLVVAFVWLRPELWFTDLRVSGLGAVILAAGATFWIALPLEILVLHFLHQWRADSPIWDSVDPSQAGGPS